LSHRQPNPPDPASLSQSAAECRATISCTYGERNVLPNGYRIHKLDVCGANCTNH
jgi:hypothetical protein